MNKVKLEEILLEKHLCCYPPENEAAKIYHQFLLEHPEYDNNETRCKIISEEREEDHYGNGGGVDNTLIIFKYREETDSEYNNRIQEKENFIIQKYTKELNNILREIKNELMNLPDESKERIIYFLKKNIDFYIQNSFLYTK